MVESRQELRPANENPWYVLMTLYGEQDGEDIDWELHERNRVAWNFWDAQRRGLQDRNNALIELSSMLETRTGKSLSSTEAQLEVRNRFKIVWSHRHPNSPTKTPAPSPSLPISMSNLIFPNHLCLQGFNFGQHLDVRQCQFLGQAILGKTHFDRGASFQKIKVSSSLSLIETTCQGNFDFRQNTVEGPSTFDEATFEKAVDVSHTIFRSRSHWTASSFARDAHFYRTVFRGPCHFLGAVFASDAFFNEVRFTQSLDFADTKFGRRAIFTAAQFNTNAFFTDVRFNSEAFFQEGRFKGDVEFTGAEFSGFTYFNTASFTGADSQVFFRDCQFGKPTNFTGTCFLMSYPDFEGTVLHDNTKFTADYEKWPSLQRIDHEDTLLKAKTSCATIRHSIAKQGLPEDEHFFFRREMYFAGKIGPWHQRLPYLIFGTLSDYGHSIRRPTYWLLTLWLIGFLAFGGYFTSCCAVAPSQALTHPFGTAAAFSFSNLLPPFGFSRLYFNHEFVKELPTAIKAYSGLQTVFSLPLLFFLGLGLRQRFRLR